MVKKIEVPNSNPASAGTDTLAANEENSFEQFKYEKYTRQKIREQAEEKREDEREENKHTQTEEIRKLYAKSYKWIIRFAVGIFIVLLIVWAWHMIAPSSEQCKISNCFHFISDSQVRNLERILMFVITSGAVISRFTSYTKDLDK